MPCLPMFLLMQSSATPVTPSDRLAIFPALGLLDAGDAPSRDASWLPPMVPQICRASPSSARWLRSVAPASPFRTPSPPRPSRPSYSAITTPSRRATPLVMLLLVAPAQPLAVTCLTSSSSRAMDMTTT